MVLWGKPCVLPCVVFLLGFLRYAGLKDVCFLPEVLSVSAKAHRGDSHIVCGQMRSFVLALPYLARVLRQVVPFGGLLLSSLYDCVLWSAFPKGSQMSEQGMRF